MLLVLANALLGFVGALKLHGTLASKAGTVDALVRVEGVGKPFYVLVTVTYVVIAAAVCSWEARREAGAYGQPLSPPSGTWTWLVLSGYWLVMTAATSLLSYTPLFGGASFPVRVGEAATTFAFLLVLSTLSVGALALRLRQLRSKSMA